MTQRSASSGRLIYFGTIVATLAVAFLASYPLYHLIRRGVQDMGVRGWLEFISSAQFRSVAIDTFAVVLIAAFLSVLVAVTLAWINDRTDAGVGTLGDVLPLVPLFIPAIAMAIGLVMLFSPRTGFANNAIQMIPGLNEFSLNIYTFWGLVAAYVIALVPYAYIPVSAGFKSLDLAKEEAARLSGAGPLRVLKDVAGRSIMPSVVASMVLVLIVGFALYSVPVVIAPRAGIDIISVRIVRSITRSYPPAYDVAVALSIVLLVLLGAMWFYQEKVIRGGRFATVGQRTEGGSVSRLGVWKWPARGILIAYLLIAAVLPTIALGLVSSL